jgi:hypothetical protein
MSWYQKDIEKNDVIDLDIDKKNKKSSQNKDEKVEFFDHDNKE